MNPPHFFVERIRKLIRYPEFGAVASLLAVMAFFSFMSPHFLKAGTLVSVITNVSETGIVAAGVSFLMISGEFDLSVGSVYAFAGMIFVLVANTGIDPAISLILAVMSGAIIGLANGLITLKVPIPSFITTLGMMMLVRGLVYYVTAGLGVYMNVVASNPLMYALAGLKYEVGGAMLRINSLWWVLVTLIFFVVLNNYRYGNWVYATGGNPAAARAMGVPMSRVKITNFMICGLLAALGGVVNTSRFVGMQPLLGEGLELETIAAAVIGGNLLSGGYGSVLGTLVGAIMVGTIRSGLVLGGAPGYLYEGLTGAIVIVAVIINTFVRKRARRT